MSNVALLLAALILDALVGEPEPVWKRVRHPVRIMGDFVSWADKKFNNGERRRAKGAALAAAGVFASLAGGALIEAVPDFGLLEVLVAATLLCQKSLLEHVRTVADGLRYGLQEGRSAVGKIVGRDVRELDGGGVARAAIESAAENFSDGVVAPAFWFAVLGLPGIVAYKFINTADSMIGYRNDRFRDFGWAAAKLDDIVNYVPARLSAALIAIAHGCWSAFRVMKDDAPRHRSPNAGWPEAALACVLGVALSGPRTYGGVAVEIPFVNSGGRNAISIEDIDRAVNAVRRTWLLGCAGLAVVALVFW